MALLGRIAEAREPDAESLRSAPMQDVSDCLRAPYGNDGDALGREISTSARSQSLDGELVADPLDEDDRPLGNAFRH